MVHWENTAQTGKAHFLFELLHKGKMQQMNKQDLIERNNRVVEEFRANGGKVHDWAPLILLTTRGGQNRARRASIH